MLNIALVALVTVVGAVLAFAQVKMEKASEPTSKPTVIVPYNTIVSKETPIVTVIEPRAFFGNDTVISAVTKFYLVTQDGRRHEVTADVFHISKIGDAWIER